MHVIHPVRRRRVAAAAFALLATVTASGLGVTGSAADATTLDPYAVVADAIDGDLTLPLDGALVRLSVRPAPWQVARSVVDEHGVERTLPGPRAVYVGDVAGVPSSAALLTVTPSGIDGYVSAAGRTVTLTPARFLDRTAPLGRTVVETVDHAVGSVLPDDSMRAASTRYVQLAPFADSAFMTRYGSSWADKISAIMSHANGVYIPDLGWGFSTPSMFSCATAGSCGSTSNNEEALLYSFALYAEGRHNAGYTFESAFLFSGRNFTSANGTSYGPGRYSVGQYVNEGEYNPESGSYEGGQLTAHELGHQLAARHDESSWTETICDTSVPVLGCLQSHQGATHRYVMCSSCNHQPPDRIWETDLNTEKSRVQTCHDGSWFNGTYVPVDTAGANANAMAMGASCPTVT